jgi:hypothetical protein
MEPNEAENHLHLTIRSLASDPIMRHDLKKIAE